MPVVHLPIKFGVDIYIYIYIHKLVVMGGRHPVAFVRWTFPEKNEVHIHERTRRLIHHTHWDIFGVASGTYKSGTPNSKEYLYGPNMTVW